MSDSWPSGVPPTLWNYTLLQDQVGPQIPMLGVRIAPEFLYMFGVGCAFIVYFAWDRFRNRRTGRDDFGFRVMREVEVAQLGGDGALLRARLLYVVTLLALYVAMTFFGKLIFQTLNGLNLAGIQVDSGALQFQSPQWPLLLAFGFAGLAPLVLPLRVAEDWLFGRAYRAVGIPVRIHETTRSLVDILDDGADQAARASETKADPAGNGKAAEASGKKKGNGKDDEGSQAAAVGSPLAAELDRNCRDLRERMTGSWVFEQLARKGKETRTIALLAELMLLVDWAKGGRGAWPGPEVSDAVRRVEADLAKQGEKLIDEFFEQLEPLAGTTEVKIARRKERLAKLLADAVILRDELLAVLAVYAERDPTYVGKPVPKPKEGDADGAAHEPIRPALRDLLSRVAPPNLAGTGPEGGLLLLMVPVGLLYAVFTWQGLHPAISQNANPQDWRTVAATAGVETLRALAIVWLPLMAAFAVRQGFHDRDVWVASAGDDQSAYTEQRLIAIGLAVVVAACGLFGIALLQAFLIAPSVSRFQALLFQGGLPFVLFFPTLAVVTVPIVYCALRAADLRAAGRTGAWVGLTCAAFVIAALAVHMAIWNGKYRTCTPLGPYLLDMAAAGCMRRYGGLDFLVYPALGFMAAAVFGNPGRVTPAERRERERQRSRLRTAGAAPAVLALAVVLALGQRAEAEEITVGFRIDAEPFSYRSDLGPTLDHPHPRQYAGFLAELCYYIFDKSDYRITEVPVDAENRFDLLETDVNGTPRIDVLCDPTTLRYSEPNRSKSGIFSPIVFASAVTYLENRDRGQRGTIYVAYVSNTTADLVLRHACDIDLFRGLPFDERDHRREMCDTAEAALLIEKLRLKEKLHDEADKEGRRDLAAKYELQEDEVDEVMEAARKLFEATKAEALFAKDAVVSASLDKKESKERLSVYWDRVAREAAELKASCLPTACDLASVRDALVGSLAALGSSCSDAEIPRLEPPAVPRTPEEGSSRAEKSEAEKADDEQRKKDLELLRATTTLYRYCPMESHQEAIRWLCGPRYGDARNKNLIYLGDREIILGKLRTWRKTERCSVASETGAEDLTYEPYALLVSKKAEDPLKLIEHVQKRIYEFFSYQPRAVAAFDTAFPDGTHISPLLANLFLLSGIEEEGNFTYPEAEKPPEKEREESAPVAEGNVISLIEGEPGGALQGPRPRGGGASPGTARLP